MLKTMLIALAATAALTVSVPERLRAEETKTTQSVTAPAIAKHGTVKVGDIDYYYEIRGEGEPLLVLHGGLGSTDMFAPIMPQLAAGRQVIGIDLQGHGRTTLGQRPIDLKAIGDDIAAVLKELGYEQVDVFGYSFGGGVAFRLAVQHPELVRRLAMTSAGYSDDGFYPEIKAQQVTLTAEAAPMMKETPMYKSYMEVAPIKEDFPRLLQAMGDLMRQKYDYSADVKTLKMPVMIAFGDSDMYKPEHIVKLYQMLGGGLKDAGWMRENISQNRLAIIPNRTHYDVFFAPELVAAVRPFLDGVTKVKSWDDNVNASN